MAVSAPGHEGLLLLPRSGALATYVSTHYDARCDEVSQNDHDNLLTMMMHQIGRD